MYPSSNNDHFELERRLSGIRYILAFSSVFQIVFTFLATSMLLNRWLPQVAVTSPNLPTEDYSKAWAYCTAASVILAMFAAVDLYSIVSDFQYHPLLSGFVISVGLLAALIEFPAAVYFARKYTIAVPGVYLVPAKVICCGKKKISALLVRTAFLLTSLTAIQLAFFHCTYLILAFGVDPFNIGSSIAMLLFCLCATVHIVTILVTLPSLCRPTVEMEAVSKEEKWNIIFQGVSLIILLIAIFCFSVVVASSGQLINIGKDQESFLLDLSQVVLPIALGLTSVLLKRFSDMWFETLSICRLPAFPNNTVDEPANSTSLYGAI